MHICVYCASSTRIDPGYLRLGEQFGRQLAARGHTLVYGGGSIGIMGAVARAVHEAKGRVIGVVPDFMRGKEIVYERSDELIVTDTMRQRKQIMEERAEAFVVLPGGIGTLEEFFETLTNGLLRQHDKPIVLLNHEGFYDPLLTLFDHMEQHGFTRPRLRRDYRVVLTTEAVFEALAPWEAQTAAPMRERGET